MSRSRTRDEHDEYREELGRLDRSDPMYISCVARIDPERSLTTAIYRQPDGIVKLHVVVESVDNVKDPNFIEILDDAAWANFLSDELCLARSVGMPN